MMSPSKIDVVRLTLRRCCLAAVVVGLAGFPAAAVASSEVPYADPWDSATVRAAEAAVARLGSKRALEIRATLIAIPGVAVTGISGAGSGIVATVQQLQQAMLDLGATETALEIHVELPADVLFDFDKADIRPDAAKALGDLAVILRSAESARIEGHTDAKGSDTYNQPLSERRAESVKRWLVQREQIDESMLQTRGWGRANPVASNDTGEGRQRNRRVEVIIRKKAVAAAP